MYRVNLSHFVSPRHRLFKLEDIDRGGAIALLSHDLEAPRVRSGKIGSVLEQGDGARGEQVVRRKRFK